MKKYTNPQAHEYLMEAKACEKVSKELRRIAEKYQRKMDKESIARQADFENAMGYTCEQDIQEAYGWGYITEKQYERYVDLFREGHEVLENLPPTPNALVWNILNRIINDIDADCWEWKFSALSPEEQIAERARQEKANQEWKDKISEIKKRRGITVDE